MSTPFTLRIAYYAAVALADEARTLPALDAYDRLTARNGVQAARLELDEDNFLRAAIAVDADDEGRWATVDTLPAVVDYAPVAPKAHILTRPIARRVACYALALLGDAPAYDGAPSGVTCGAAAAYSVDKLSLRDPEGGRRVESIISSVCGVSL